MTLLQDVAWRDPLVEPHPDAEFDKRARAEFGVPNATYRHYYSCPWVARMVTSGNLRNGKLAHLDIALNDLIFLAVSADNSCRYCYSGQRLMLRFIGYDEKRIRDLEAASFEALSDPRERLAIDYARRFSRANPPVSAADKQALSDAGFSDGEVLEIAYSAARAVTSNRLTTLPALPISTDDGTASIAFKWFRPIIAWMFNRVKRRGEPVTLAPELREGPFAYVGLALDGLPAARLSRTSILDAWASDFLPRRTKALIFAVIARGLGSARAEAEATRLLDEEGFTEESTREVLAHLGSAALDSLDAAIVPFARETIRYRVEDIQKRAALLKESLSDAEFIELVGLVSLANSTCRLSLALCEGE
jgi:AhpD family alkylhydroperoxidase